MHYSTLLLATLAANLGAATPTPSASSTPYLHPSAFPLVEKYPIYAVLLHEKNKDGGDECFVGFKSSENPKCNDRSAGIGLYDEKTGLCQKDGGDEPTRAQICGDYVASLYYDSHDVQGGKSQPGSLDINKYGWVPGGVSVVLGTRPSCWAGWNSTAVRWEGNCLGNSTKSH